jgi:hypothetical protein
MERLLKNHTCIYPSLKQYVEQLVGFSSDEVKLVLFHFTLKDKAKHWFLALPLASNFTWDEMQQQFLEKYYTPQRTSEARNAIRGFQ